MHIHLRFQLLIVISSLSLIQPLPNSIWKPREMEHIYGDALEAVLGIGIRLQALFEDPAVITGNNFMVSPLSAALLISQLMLGSEGKFRDDLFNLLSLPSLSDHKNSVIRYHKKNITYTLPYAQLHLQMRNLFKDLEGKDSSKLFTIKSSNGLFVNSNIKLKEEFVQLLEIYDTDIRALDFSSDPFGSQKIINDWVDLQTNGLIKYILSSPLPKSAAAIFTNAVYFSAEWETPFSYEMNMKGAFHVSEDKSVNVEYMQGFFENLPYAESTKLGCRMLALPYKNNELAMYFILPYDNSTNLYNLRQFGDNLRTKNLLEFISQAKPHSVSAMIPKLKLTNSISILEPLQRYAAFEKQTNTNSEADKNRFDVLDKRVELFTTFNTTDDVDITLSRAADNDQMKISNIIQEMTLSVNERGTEAAAVTAGIIEYMGGSKNFRVDRPFIFFIRHTQTSAILFWGAISDPTKTQ